MNHHFRNHGMSNRRPSTIRIRKLMAISLPVLVIIGVAILGGSQSLVRAVAIAPPVCTRNYPSGLTLQSGNWTVNNPGRQVRTAFDIEGNSTAAICVTYQISGLGSQGSLPTISADRP